MDRLRTRLPRFPLAGAIKYVASAMAALALLLSQGYAKAADAQLIEENRQLMSHRYPGLNIQGHNDDDSRSLEIEKTVQKMIEKCRTDSSAFRLLLSDLAMKLPTGKTVTINEVAFQFVHPTDSEIFIAQAVAAAVIQTVRADLSKADDQRSSTISHDPPNCRSRTHFWQGISTAEQRAGWRRPLWCRNQHHLPSLRVIFRVKNPQLNVIL